MEDLHPFSWRSETQRNKTDQIDNEGRLLWGSNVKTKHRRLTNLAFIQLVPGADRAVRHICIRSILIIIIVIIIIIIIIIITIIIIIVVKC